jgi:hypothetical protein
MTNYEIYKNFIPRCITHIPCSVFKYQEDTNEEERDMEWQDEDEWFLSQVRVASRVAKILFIGVSEEVKQTGLGTLLLKQAMTYVKKNEPKVESIYFVEDDEHQCNDWSQVHTFFIKNQFLLTSKDGDGPDQLSLRLVSGT